MGFFSRQILGTTMKIIEYLSSNKPVIANYKPDLNYFFEVNNSIINDSTSIINLKDIITFDASFNNRDNEYIKRVQLNNYNKIFNEWESFA